MSKCRGEPVYVPRGGDNWGTLPQTLQVVEEPTNLDRLTCLQSYTYIILAFLPTLHAGKIEKLM